MSLPATYILDPETNEATGVTYTYCSLACQRADRPNLAEPASCEPTGGEETDAQVCSYCGDWLDV